HDMNDKGTKGPRIYQADFLTALFRDPLDPAYVQAAEDKRNKPPPPPWKVLTRKVITLICLVVIGFLFAVAYLQVVRDAPDREKVRAGLITRINQQKERTTKLAADAEALQDEVATLRDLALLDPAQAQELRHLEAATGVSKVSGDGLVVRLADGPDAATNSKARILDYDLQQLVNALWSFGAEAVSINGRRLTSVSAIRKGGGIYVGDFPVVSPYEISAIGPPDLYDNFSKSLTAQIYRDLAQRPEHRFGFKITKQDDLVLPAALLPELRYAKVPNPSPSPTPSGGR
ncbi:MAG TPA: DUF881 domain-containing protein, partial [Candidatus Limnocylindrales bacterium]|nr:DUF881 domain-containing protein [Candidatus Limnocylindrales bacterium]